MRDLNEERIKTLLHNLSGEARPDGGRESQTLRRARRRRALNASVAGAMALVLVVGALAGIRVFSSPTPLVPGQEVGDGWFYAGTLEEIRREGVVYLQAQMVFIVDTNEGPLALSALSTHPGTPLGEQLEERVLYCPSSGWFMEQFHGGQFDGEGHYVLGPPPRGLDRVAVRVNGASVEFNPDRVTLGPPRGHPTPINEPAGRFCGSRSGPVEGRPGFALVSSGSEPENRPAIVVETPTDGDRVSSPVTISGEANVFEANVRIRIIDAVNNIVADTFTTATCGSGCRGTFSTEVEFSVGSEQSGVIQVFEESAAEGEGPPILNKVTIPVTLLPSPPDASEPAVVGSWTDAAGEPTYVHDDTGTHLRLHVYRGADHCGWTSALFLSLAWPVGTTADTSEGIRQYVRDPHGVFAEGVLRGRLDQDAQLPANATPSGFSKSDWELWTSPSDDRKAIYIVGPDRVERWPRATPSFACA